MGNNGNGNGKGPEDVLLKIEIGANDQGDPIILVTDTSGHRLILGVNVPRAVLMEYVSDQGGEMNPLEAMRELLATTFRAIMESLESAIEVSKK